MNTLISLYYVKNVILIHLSICMLNLHYFLKSQRKNTLLL